MSEDTSSEFFIGKQSNIMALNLTVVELYEESLLPAAMISIIFVLVSLFVIAFLYRYAHKQLQLLHKSKKALKKVSPFWMESILVPRKLEGHRGKVYILLSFVISLIVMIASDILPILVAGPNPWWWAVKPTSIAYTVITHILLVLSIMMGFLIPRQLYHYFVDEALEDMKEKAKATSQPKRVTRTLKMFTLVA